jgi:hypothetical protein
MATTITKTAKTAKFEKEIQNRLLTVVASEEELIVERFRTEPVFANVNETVGVFPIVYCRSR